MLAGLGIAVIAMLAFLVGMAVAFWIASFQGDD